MRQVGSHVITIASPENLFLVTDGHFKAAAGNIGTLGMGMLMKGADCSLLELYFYHHQVLVVAHNLTDYALTGILPLYVGGYLVGVACLFHKSELDGKFIIDVAVLYLVSQFFASKATKVERLTDGLLIFVFGHCYCCPCILSCHI